MKEPFNTHYFYYLLAERLEQRIKDLFQNQDGASIEKAKKILQTDTSAYIRHRLGVVDDVATIELRDLLFLFLGVNPKKERIDLENGNLDEIQNWKYYKKYLPKQYTTEPKAENWVIQPGQIKKFWLKARRCDKTLAGENDDEDVNVLLMDLLAFFCGYQDFRDFIYTEFGVGYRPETDPVLIRQYETYSYLIPGTDHRDNQIAILENGKTEIDQQFPPPESDVFSQRTKSKTLWRFASFIFLAFAGAAAAFYFFGRVDQAEVRMTLTTDYLHFETLEEVTLRSSEGNVFSSTNHFYIHNGLYSLNYPFSNSLPASLKIESIQSAPVGITHLKLPAQTGITIEAPTKRDVYFELLEPEGLEGNLRLRNLVAFSSAEDSSVTYGDTPIGTGINFQSAPNQNLQLSLIQAGEFELPPILVNSVAFGKLGQQKVEYGILSGQIELPEYGKSFVLNSRDMLSLSLQNPSKLIISYREGVLSVTFSGFVNSLQTGIDAAKPNGGKNLLPKRIESWASFPNSLIAGLLFTALIVAYQMKKSR